MIVHYVEPVRFPTEKAHGYQIARTAESLSGLVKLTAYFTERKNPLTSDYKEYYSLNNGFNVQRIGIFDLLALDLFQGRILTFLLYLERLFFFSRYASRFFSARKEIVVYSRNFLSCLLSLAGFNVFLEEHDPPVSKTRSLVYRLLLPGLKGVVCISKGVEQRIKQLCSTVPTKIIPDATDIPDRMPERDRCRYILGLEKDEYTAVYTGSISVPWKGVSTVMKAAALVPDITFLVVGGTREQARALYPQAPSNVRFIPRVPQERVILFLRAADVLLAPNTAGSPNSVRFTSPLKLFEYFSSRVPVIASDLPSLRDIAGNCACYTDPGDATGLASAITSLREGSLAPDIEKAEKIAQQNTWELRAGKIMSFITQMV